MPRKTIDTDSIPAMASYQDQEYASFRKHVQNRVNERRRRARVISRLREYLIQRKLHTDVLKH